MNSNEKRWIVLLVAVIIIAIVLIVAIVGMNDSENQAINDGQNEVQMNEESYTTQLDDGTKINTSEEMSKMKTYKNLEISNIQFTEKNGMSVLLADVTNKGNTTHEEEVVKITILGENNEEIAVIHPSIEEIEPGGTAKINASISADVTNAKDFVIEEEE